MTCGAPPLVACTLDDVVIGLAQVSEQLQNLSAYIVVVSAVAVASVILSAIVLLFSVRGS